MSNPIPFNPHLVMTGEEQRNALEALRVIFTRCADENATAEEIGNAANMQFLGINARQ